MTASVFTMRRLNSWLYFRRCRLSGGGLPSHLARFNDFVA
jgi:hypothetical protein